MSVSGRQLPIPVTGFTVVPKYSVDAVVTLCDGDRLDLLRQIPSGEAQLVVTSPPYNIGKKYERKGVLSNTGSRRELMLAGR